MAHKDWLMGRHHFKRNIMSGQKAETTLKDPILSRAQRRDKQRREDEAKSVYETLAKRFFDHFIKSENPESEDLLAIKDSIDTQWRVYCRRANLIPSAYDMIKTYASELIMEFKETKDKAKS